MIQILFIDDDPQASKFLSTMLHGQFTVVSALSAVDGLEILNKTVPDVVMSNIIAYPQDLL